MVVMSEHTSVPQALQPAHKGSLERVELSHELSLVHVQVVQPMKLA